MKKFGVLLMTSALVLSLAGCGSTTETVESNVTESTEESSVEESSVEESSEEESSEEESTEESSEEAPEADGSVMSYAEYAAADLDSDVVVETYVQAKQSWWEDKATFYTQDLDGAYFLYNMPCTEEEYALLTPGTKIRVTGYKSEWAGEVEIADATFEIIEGDTFVADAKDVTEFLGTDELIDYQNQFVSFKDMTVVAAGQDENGEDVAFLYKWDGSGEDGDDLYFNVAIGDTVYTFTVESYLCDKDSDVYAAVKALEIGQTVDMEGFLYWYEGVNPHITSVTVK